MLKHSLEILTVFLVVIFHLSTAAQSALKQQAPPDGENNTAPVVWERYRKTDKRLSILMPKMPVVTGLRDDCANLIGAAHHAFADQAVFEFRYYEKGDERFLRGCTPGIRFGPETLERRLEELRRTKPVSETPVELNGRSATVFAWETPAETAKRWVISNLANDRWIEISVNRRKDSIANENKFAESFVFDASNGKEIGEGAERTLGDAAGPSTAPMDKVPEGQRDPVSLVNKPRASYTEVARKASTMGSVKLRVTFLANGGIGAVTVIEGLENGLTEQSVAAARRMAFLPQRLNGTPVNIVKMVIYSFTIY